MNTKLKYASVFLLAVAVAATGTWREYSYRKQVQELSNLLAERDKTIETQRGLYAKLTLQTGQVQNLLNEKDTQISALKDELKKNEEKIATLVALNASLKKPQEGSPPSNQTTVVVGNKERKKVEFSGPVGSGFLKVDGYTLTDPAESHLSISQVRPFRLTVVVSQDKQGVWKSRVASSGDELSIDMAVAAVNPFIFSKKWYENIDVSTSSYLISSNGLTFFQSVDVHYDFGKFSLGPTVGFSMGGGPGGFYGIGFTWKPFR